MLSCHYFDDELIMDFGELASKTQSMSHRLSDLWGIRYSEKKRHTMSVNTHFLGNAYDCIE